MSKWWYMHSLDIWFTVRWLRKMCNGARETSVYISLYKLYNFVFLLRKVPPPKKSFLIINVYLHCSPNILEGQELLIWLWMYFMRDNFDEVWEATEFEDRSRGCCCCYYIMYMKYTLCNSVWYHFEVLYQPLSQTLRESHSTLCPTNFPAAAVSPLLKMQLSRVIQQYTF